MTHDDSSKRDPRTSGKEVDKYGGVVAFDLTLTPSVIIGAVAGGILGLILAMWGNIRNLDHRLDSDHLCGTLRDLWPFCALV